VEHAKLVSKIAIGLAVVSIAALFLLHFLSAEIDPVWHMVSEYAFGRYGWVLTIFFFAWGLATWVTALAILPWAKNWTSKLSIILLFISGLGAIMGGLFDARHPLHGLAFGLGVPFLPIAAILITRHLRKTHGMDSTNLRIAAHVPWISVILMGTAMWLFISGMQNAGALPSGTPELITTLPEGVIGLHGIPNRLLVLSYLAWLIVINKTLLHQKERQ
jgi:hypothetical membrane protein